MAHGWRRARAASHLVRGGVGGGVRVRVRVGVRVRVSVRIRIKVGVGVRVGGRFSARGEDNVRRLVVAGHADVDVVAGLELGVHVGRSLVVRPRLREADHLVRVRVRVGVRVGVRVRVGAKVRVRVRVGAQVRVRVGAKVRVRVSGLELGLGSELTASPSGSVPGELTRRVASGEENGEPSACAMAASSSAFWAATSLVVVRRGRSTSLRGL